MLRLTIYLDAPSANDYNWGVGHLGISLIQMSIHHKLPADSDEVIQEAFEQTTEVVNPDTNNLVSYYVKLEDSGNETQNQTDGGDGSKRELSVTG